MTPRQAEIVAAARGWLGTPYRHQASLKGVGCDCLGLLRGVWRETVGPEPETPGPYTPDWAEAGGREALFGAASRRLRRLEAIEPGAVALFRWRDGSPAKHCAVATSRESVIHAHDGACVVEVALAGWLRRGLVAVFAFPERTPA